MTMTDEDQFIMQQWIYLDKCQKENEKLDGILCLGDAIYGQQNNLEAIKMLNSLMHNGFFEGVPNSDPRKPYCFKFTKCGERHVKFLTSGV